MQEIDKLMKFKLKLIKKIKIESQILQQLNYSINLLYKKMITLDKLTVQVGPKLFTLATKKLLKIQAQNSIIKTNNYAKVITATSLQWDQAIQIPLLYGKNMPFQIYEKHQFGYNPEEIVKIMHGTINFVKGNQKYLNWEIFDSSQKKIGFLSVNIKNKPVSAAEMEKLGKILTSETFNKIIKQKVVDQTKLIIISSIVVNIPTIKAKRGYAQICVGGQTIQTAPSKSRSGQLVFVQKYQLEKKQQINEGMIDIYSCGVDQPDQKIATAIIQLDKKFDRKLKFCSPEGNEIGEGFIDGKVQLKSDVFTERMVAGLIKNSFKKQSPTQNNSTLSKSVLGNRNFMRSSIDYSLDLSSSRKKMSVLNHNSNIKIPQEKRFLNLRDPPNNKVSYLHEQNFQFKEKQIDKYYRGASIGYGNKADFTAARKGLPSVGKYNLPSIWDRY